MDFAGPGNDYRPLAALPAGPLPSVTVVVPVYERAELLDRTLASLVPQTHSAFDVVVADDGSTEPIKQITDRWADRLSITYVRQEHNGFGLARARNLGAASATGELLLFLDADCIARPDLVERHLDWHRRADNLLVAGSRFDVDSSAWTPESLASGTVELPPVGDAGPDGWRKLFYRRTRRLVLGDAAFRAAIGANLSVRRDRFDLAGGFDEAFTAWGGEDTEFTWRVWNDGAFVVPADDAAFHQTQFDRTDRAESRARTMALVADRVPHRFYRKVPTPFASVPKVSWWVRVETADEADIAWRECSKATFADAEFVVSGPEAAVGHLRILDGQASRVRVFADGEPAASLLATRGELVALLDGRTRINRTVLAAAVDHLDQEPRAATVRTGYRFDNGDRYLHLDDLAAVDKEVGRLGLPLFAVARRRELMKDRALLSEPAELWQAVCARDPKPQLMVRDPATVAGSAPAPRPGAAAREVVATGAAELARAAVRRARRRTEPASVEDGSPTDERVKIAYVGLTGKHNLGDDAVLAAVERLMPWADFGTDHRDPRLLMVGGGTLINGKRYYLNKMLRQDTPTVDRVLFGTGVRNPEHWGVTEPMEDWFSFFDSAVLAGVRGPDSVANLRRLGYHRDLEILGDPALSLEPPAGVERVPGRVVVCPLHTEGNLHGGDDTVVLDALAATIRRLRRSGNEVVMLSAYPQDDRWIIGLMDEVGERLPYQAGYADLDASMELLASADLVIGERLHAAILAAACFTPFVALQYRPKVLDFTKSIGQETATVRTDEMQRLDEVVDWLLSDPASVSAAIAPPVEHFRARHREAAEMLRRFTSE